MGKYFNNKYCVYLDQFAVSNCAVANPADEWKEIKQTLLAGVHNETLVIPYSHDHLLESAHKDVSRAHEQDRFLFELSGGVAIRTEPDITERLLLNHGRKRPVGISNFCEKHAIMGFDKPDNFGRLGTRKTSFNAMIEEVAKPLNYLRPLTATTPCLNQQQREAVIAYKVRYYENELLFRLKKVARNKYWVPKSVPFAVQTVPFWADALLAGLLHKHGMTPLEAKRIKEALEKGGLKATAPPLFIRANLEAAMGLKHQKETPNDYVDVQRMAAALPVADLVLTDKAKCFDIKSLALDKLYKTEVYSGSWDDLQLFHQRLRKIVFNEPTAIPGGELLLPTASALTSPKQR